MGKFKKGVRVRLIEDHDSSATAGMIGTIVGKGPFGDRDVVLDNFTKGHDGLDNDGSTNHWFVPKSKLEVVEEEPAKPRFTIGDRATALDGEQVAIDSEVDDIDHVWIVSAEGNRRRVPVSWLSEAWETKVGDRVRHADRGAGSILRVVSEGAHVRYDTWNDGHDGHTGDGSTNCWWNPLGDLQPQPVAAEAQPAVAAPLTIQAGRYYKTRDGRKVGPMEDEDDLLADGYPFTAYHCDCPDYFDASGKAQWYGNDLIAEWTEADEPVVAVEAVAVAEATATPKRKRKFNIGDKIVRAENDAPWAPIGYETIVQEGMTYTDIHGDSGISMVDQDWELAPANDNDLVVTITAKNESVADALRTLAAALNAA